MSKLSEIFRKREYSTFPQTAESLMQTMEEVKRKLDEPFSMPIQNKPTENYADSVMARRRRSPIEMINMRLHTPEYGRINLNWIDAYVSDTVALVFVVDRHDNPVTLKDDPHLFPSDTLITQLRLLIG